MEMAKKVIGGEWSDVLKFLTGIEISTLPEKLKGLIEQLKELATSILSPALAISKEKAELAEKIQKNTECNDTHGKDQ